MAAKPDRNFKIASENRRARFDYEIGETFEAGLMLTGTEVKSLRTGKATIAESYGSSTAMASFISSTRQFRNICRPIASTTNPNGPRKLLLKMREIVKLAQGVEREGMTIVPMKIYFNEQGRAKIEIALGRGKKLHDKRETEKKRDWNREKSRVMKERG